MHGTFSSLSFPDETGLLLFLAAFFSAVTTGLSYDLSLTMFYSSLRLKFWVVLVVEGFF